ncbi:allophanate hydrolase subunit 1 [Solwaraspora sp. WMMD1047]|uniref:5-oxoprolinase subunit B family protein n=1 Tax=Solwaraspora sp. WMMD1047 TaxID=3016102 RepID=UPI002415C839|nr:allophanate hydrolase subunit 1 [Solwaraspora sp. WMMD1047]MDG4834598.1 allophanate hydrolase subunit 1 [Solwaraspora sp. WMMD1047]
MRIRPVGTNALLLEFEPGEPVEQVDDDPADREGGPADQVESWRAELWRRRETGDLTAADIVPAARTILIDGTPDPEATAALIAGWPPPPAAGSATGSLLEIPIEYDGEDLPDVAALWGVDVTEAVRRISDTELRVAFCGFSPGFGYLTGLPADWAVPRLATPRPKVPAGSVALAGPYAGIYPTASPGGWRLIGRTDVPLFDVHRDPPALLVPGTRVRLVPA